MDKIKFFIIKIIRLFFSYLGGGEKCVVCGSTSYLYPVCKKCIRQHFHITKESFENRCSCCGRELISTTGLCSKCREETILNNSDKVSPLFSYRLWNKELLFMWKIKGERNLSFFFGNLVYNALNILNYKIVVPVPPRKGKIKKKGWDQIKELCDILSGQYNIIIMNLLERLSVEEQKKLNRNERLETIKSAYSITGEKLWNKELKKNNGKVPESVCLIDDVCTTGATIECCCEILKKSGIKTVNVITLFTVD